MKTTAPHFLLVALAIGAAATITGCANSSPTPPAPNTHNDGSQKVHSGPYNSLGSADPQAPREPR